MPPAQTTSRWNGIGAPWLFAVALLPVLGLAAWHWSGGPGVAGSDYAQYILHGRALADGRPYRDIGYIYTLFNRGYAPPVQPPGLPLVLALLFRVFGPGLLAPRLVLLGAALTFFVLAGVFFARHAGRPIGLGVTLLAGLAAPVVPMLSQIQSDLPFAALLWGAILLYDTDGCLSARRLAAITILGVLAILFRVAGVALIPAALLHAFANRRTAGARAAVPPALWLLAGALAQLVAPSAGGFVRMVAHWPLGVAWVGRTADRLFRFRFTPIDAALYPFASGVANDIYHVAAGLLMVAGGVALFRRLRGGFLTWLVVCYAAMLLLSPVAVHRYLWPFLPVFAAMLLAGIAQIARRSRLGPERAEWAALAVAVVIAAGTLARPPQRLGRFTDYPDVGMLFDRIRSEARARPGMRVAFARALILTEQTGVAAMPTFAAPPDTIVAVIRRRCLTHVVLGDLGVAIAADHAFRFAVARNRPLFEVEFRNPSFTLLRVTDTGCAAGEGGAASRAPGRSSLRGAA